MQPEVLGFRRRMGLRAARRFETAKCARGPAFEPQAVSQPCCERNGDRCPRLEEISPRDGESSGSSGRSGESARSWFGAVGSISTTDAAQAHGLNVARVFA